MNYDRTIRYALCNYVRTGTSGSTGIPDITDVPELQQGEQRLFSGFKISETVNSKYYGYPVAYRRS